MVSRNDLQVAVYDEIAAAVEPLSVSVTVQNEYPDDEDLPAVIHSDAYRQVPMNNKTGAKSVSTENTEERRHIYSMVKEGQFTLTVAAQALGVKESIYHALESHFESYTFPIRNVSDIHEDVNRVEFADVNSTDDEDSSPVTVQDTLTVRVEYERFYDTKENMITDVESDVSGEIRYFNNNT